MPQIPVMTTWSSKVQNAPRESRTDQCGLRPYIRLDRGRASSEQYGCGERRRRRRRSRCYARIEAGKLFLRLLRLGRVKSETPPPSGRRSRGRRGRRRIAAGSSPASRIAAAARQLGVTRSWASREANAAGTRIYGPCTELNVRKSPFSRGSDSVVN
jgi:hypothetical protein